MKDARARDLRGARAAWSPRRLGVLVCLALGAPLLTACGDDAPARPVPAAVAPIPDRPVPAYLKGTPQGAVAGGDLAGVRALLEKPPLAVDGQGRTLLHIAAIHGRLEIARWLLDHGQRADAKDEQGGTPLHAAAYGIHWIQPGDDHGMRLFRGCGNEQEAVARLLLDRGADPRARDDGRFTPLHYAAKGGNPGVAGLLIERGAEVRAADEDGTTPLHEAAMGGSHEPRMDVFTIPGEHAAVARLLLARGAVPDAPSSMGTSLGVAMRFGALDVAKILLDAGASPSVEVGGWHGPPIHGAAYEGHVDLLLAFLEKGAPLETRDGQGRTPLCMGALAGREDVVRLLLERGAKVDMVDTDGSTALHAAARSGHVPTLALLVHRGGDVQAKDGVGATLLHAAAGGCRAGGVMLDYLLEKGLAIDARDAKGRTPLAIAETSDCLIGGSPMTEPLRRRGARR